MSIQETQDHTASLLGHDAEQIVVGPPPLARIVADGRRGRRRRALGVGVAAAALVAVGAVGLGQFGIGPVAGENSRVAAERRSTLIPGVPDPIKGAVTQPTQGYLHHTRVTTTAEGDQTIETWTRGEVDEKFSTVAVTTWTRTADGVDSSSLQAPPYVIFGGATERELRATWRKNPTTLPPTQQDAMARILGDDEVAPSFKVESLPWIVKSGIGEVVEPAGSFHGTNAFAVQVTTQTDRDVYWFDLDSWQFIGQEHTKTDPDSVHTLPDFVSVVSTEAVQTADGLPADMQAQKEIEDAEQAQQEKEWAELDPDERAWLSGESDEDPPVDEG